MNHTTGTAEQGLKVQRSYNTARTRSALSPPHMVKHCKMSSLGNDRDCLKQPWGDWGGPEGAGLHMLEIQLPVCVIVLSDCN